VGTEEEGGLLEELNPVATLEIEGVVAETDICDGGGEEKMTEGEAGTGDEKLSRTPASAVSTL